MLNIYYKIINCIVITIILIAPSAFSANAHFDSNFQQGMKTATSLHTKAFDTMKQFRPNEVIKNYTENPKEINYQNKPETMKPDGVTARQNDPTAKAIADGIDERKKQFNYVIDPNSQELQHIKQNADQIYDVITGQFSDCTKKTNCKVTYLTHICEESPPVSLKYCKKKLVVDMVPHQEDTHYKLNVHVYNKKRKYAGVVVNTINGQLSVLDPHDTEFTLSGRLPSNLDCNSLQGKVIAEQGDAKIDYIYFPSCATSFQLNFHVSGGHTKNFQVDITSTKISYEPKDQWQDDCAGLAASCIFKEERCIDMQATHVIQNIPVTRDCWEKEATYQCGGTSNVHECESYRDQGCEQIGSNCKNLEDGGCTLYQQTFRCPIKECSDVGMICNGETYCLDGNCVKQQKQADPDFQRAVSALSAMHDAAKDFTNFNSIFAGKKKTCDKFVANFLDCCADKGWGKDHIASCSQEEKDLQVDKKNLLTTYAGEYCKKDFVGKCIEHRKAYCVFPSRLAQIIQQQGRKDQLHIDFGDPEDANCRGLTREEFAQLDLGKMDFKNFYADISQKTHVKDSAELNKRMITKIESLEREKKPNG